MYLNNGVSHLQFLNLYLQAEMQFSVNRTSLIFLPLPKLLLSLSSLSLLPDDASFCRISKICKNFTAVILSSSQGDLCTLFINWYISPCCTIANSWSIKYYFRELLTQPVLSAQDSTPSFMVFLLQCGVFHADVDILDTIYISSVIFHKECLVHGSSYPKPGRSVDFFFVQSYHWLCLLALSNLSLPSGFHLSSLSKKDTRNLIYFERYDYHLQCLLESWDNGWMCV